MPHRDRSAKPGSERIKEFKVVRRLGKGAFGTVYQVVRQSDGNTYALKKVNISAMSTREIEDALNEIRFLASVKHPNIVGFLEAFLNERSMELCIVMEFADGGDLNDKIEKAQKSKRYLNESIVWAYFLQLLEGVICLHEHKVLHRDLKTANCFLTLDGRLKIGDLNVSKLARMGLVKTQIGTPYYMSPEIWQNRPYDDKSDMWSIGCILYEMCALRPPFRGRDLEDLAKRVQAGYYPRIPSQYSSDLDATVRQLLSQDPRRRPSAKQALELPQVRKRLKEHKKMLMGTLISELQSEGSEMLATIHVPRNIRRITNQLPKPAYPDMRPQSPSAWPVTAEGRAQEIDRQARGHQPTIAEEDEESKHTSHSAPKPAVGHHSSQDPASRSDPMQRGSGASARAAARQQVNAGGIPGVQKYQPYRRGAGGDARSVASGYSHNTPGYGAPQRARAVPSSGYGQGIGYTPSVAGPRIASGGRAALPAVVEHTPGSHHSAPGAPRSHRSRGGRSHHSGRSGHSSGSRHAVHNPYKHHGYAAKYHSPYGQAAQAKPAPAPSARPSYPQPQRYSRNNRGGYGGGGGGGAYGGGYGGGGAAAYGAQARGRAPSHASVASSAYNGYRNNGAYSHRSNASRPSWWG